MPVVPMRLHVLHALLGQQQPLASQQQRMQLGCWHADGRQGHAAWQVQRCSAAWQVQLAGPRVVLQCNGNTPRLSP